MPHNRHPATQINCTSAECDQLMAFIDNKPGISERAHEVHGSLQVLAELYLSSDTATRDKADIATLPGVERVMRIFQECRILGHHKDEDAHRL